MDKPDNGESFCWRTFLLADFLIGQAVLIRLHILNWFHIT